MKKVTTSASQNTGSEIVKQPVNCDCVDSFVNVRFAGNDQVHFKKKYFP